MDERIAATTLTAETIIDETPADPDTPEILFRSDNLEVRRVVAGDGRHRVVTFESYHDDEGFGRPGFGEGFFAREGLTAIHVLSAGNDWYQYPEIDRVLALLADATAGAERVLAYGSSMGGYAALRFADAIGASHVLALSPQYTVDRRIVPRDRRWWWRQDGIAFLAHHNGAIRCGADAVVVYDPTLPLDQHHIDLIARDIPVRLAAIPYAGHPVTTMLAELHLLQPLATAFSRNGIDPAALVAECRRREEQSSVWLVEHAARFAGRSAARAAMLVEQALAIAPGSGTIQHHYGMRLHEAGRYEEAIAAHRRAIEIERHPIFVVGLSRSLLAIGAYAEALAYAEEALAGRPYDAEYFRWIAHLRFAIGDRHGAVAESRRAFALSRTLRNWLSLQRYRIRTIGARAADR